MLRNSLDRRSILFVCLAVAALVLPQLAGHVRLETLPLAGQLAGILCTSVLCFIANIVNHNHMHRRIFRHDRDNLLFNLLLSVARGHSATGIVVPHHLNHHLEAGSERDWIRPSLAGKGIGWLRLVRYVILASITMMIERGRPGAPVLPPRRHRSQRMEKLFLGAVIGVAAFHDWKAFLLFDIAPWLLALFMLVAVNLLQHDACHPETALGHSRDFTGAIGNWIFFNNGFHTAHHWRPATHWSELPALHAALRPQLPASRQQFSSILIYLWRSGWSARD